MRSCSIAGCERALYSRGWCAQHYNRWRRHGDPLAGRPVPVLTLVERKEQALASRKQSWLDQANAAVQEIRQQSEQAGLSVTADLDNEPGQALLMWAQSSIARAQNLRNLCPHVDFEKPQPLALDAYRNWIGCGTCANQRRRDLPVLQVRMDCDGCGQTGAPEMYPAMIRVGTVVAVFLTCPACTHAMGGLDEARGIDTAVKDLP